MQSIRFLLILFLITVTHLSGFAQNPDSVVRLCGVVCDENKNPLFSSHIINLNTGRGSTSDNSGYFCITAGRQDSILIRNLAYNDLTFFSGDFKPGDTLHLKTRLYAIKEVKIFEWGTSYADFSAKMKSMPVTENLAEKLGLPQQKGNPVSDFKNPEVLSNPFFALTNPVDFLYYNLNKKEQSVRKVLEFKQNEVSIRKFESVYNRSSISALTGLKNEKLDAFMVYLNLNFKCDFNCSEVQIVTEIFKHWKDYSEKDTIN